MIHMTFFLKARKSLSRPASMINQEGHFVTNHTPLPRTAIACVLLAAAAVASAAPVTLQPGDGKDAQIADGSLAGTNFGNSSELIINWAGNLRSVGLIEFDLSAYAGGSVSSATLGLFHTANGSAGSTYKAYRITSAWAEGTVTFNTAPTFDATPVASMTIGDSSQGVYRNWDVTAVVNDWLSGTYANYGLWIEEIPVSGSATAYFASSDWGGSAYDPKLTMDYTAPAGVPEPASLLLVGAALASAGLARRRRA